MRISIFLVLLALLLSNCIRTVDVTPIPCNQFDDCKETIQKILLKQSPVPSDVTVTDETFAWSYDTYDYDEWTGNTTSRRLFKFFYEDIYDMRVVHDNSGRFEIRFKSKTSKDTYMIFLYDKQHAIQGYSAINCMIESSNK